ncbi:transposase [Cystobacter fuscus]|nr:transposase [Cystobacter fuscus]
MESWTRERRVVANAQEHEARDLYEQLYCARGDMENRIKEQQLDLFADRTSAHSLRANQLRLWFASAAYVLLNLLRHFGLRGTEMEWAQASTIRLKLLKVAAIVRVSVRCVVLSLSAAAPVKDLIACIAQQLRQVPTPS